MLRVVVLFIFLFSGIVQADSTSKTPEFTFELQGGTYQPADENWESYYGSSSMLEMSMSFAYRVFSVLDLGTSISFGQDKGVGVLPLSQLRAGNVSYEMMPIDFYAVLRARFSHRQWIVPYAGGGYTRFFYRQSIDGEGFARGSVNALHARAGLQFLLDPLEPDAARGIYQNYGVINSYLVLEGKMIKAEAGTPVVNLGGISYRMGFLVEY